ncbi:MAG: asparagine synthase C-terminal domain-containing protein, partial [bacterium]
HLGTLHTELVLTPAEAQAVIPLLPAIYDEPFADVSQIPTYLVSKLARRAVTVSLSGDGGDELFAGYSKYAWAERIRYAGAWLPGPLRRAVSSALTAVPPAVWNAVLRGRGSPAEKIRKAAGALAGETAVARYRGLVSCWPEESGIVPGATAPATVLDDPARWPRLDGFQSWMMYTDLVSYLPDDILVKVDRASMAVSLEARVPLLDHRVVEFAWSLPLEAKLVGGSGKLPLRRLLDRYVPRRLVDRPKAGFGVPVGAWLRGPLRDWAEALLDEPRLAREGWLAPAPVRRIWADHLAGRADGTARLWPVLMFQAWLDTQ